MVTGGVVDPPQHLIGAHLKQGGGVGAQLVGWGRVGPAWPSGGQGERGDLLEDRCGVTATGEPVPRAGVVVTDDQVGAGHGEEGLDLEGVQVRVTAGHRGGGGPRWW